MSRSQFSYTRDQLIALSRIVIEHAARQGATAADTEISEGVGQNVSVRQGEIETIEHNKERVPASPSTSASGAAMPRPRTCRKRR